MGISDRRRQILDAARDIFAEKGYHRTRVSDIVAAVGVAQGTFYLYFPNKRAVLFALLDELFDLLLKRVREANVPEVGGREDISQQVARLLADLSRTYQENRVLTKLLFCEASTLDQGLREKLNARYIELVGLIQTYLQRGVDQGLIRGLDTEVAAYALLGLADQAAFHWLVLKKEGAPLDRLIEEQVRFGLYGLLGEGPDG